MNSINREKIISEIVQRWCNNMDEKDLIHFFWEKQEEFLMQESDNDILVYADDLGIDTSEYESKETL